MTKKLEKSKILTIILTLNSNSTCMCLDETLAMFHLTDHQDGCLRTMKTKSHRFKINLNFSDKMIKQMKPMSLNNK